MNKSRIQHLINVSIVLFIAIVLESVGQELLFVGDSITNINFDFEHPDWHLAFDLEPKVAS